MAGWGNSEYSGKQFVLKDGVAFLAKGAEGEGDWAIAQFDIVCLAHNAVSIGDGEIGESAMVLFKPCGALHVGLVRHLCTVIRCSAGCTRIPTGELEDRRTGAEETEWSRRQQQRESEEFHSQTRSWQKHQECTKRSPTLEAVHVPQSGGGAGTPGACRTRTEVRATLGSTGTAT